MQKEIFTYDSHIHTIYSGHSHKATTVDAIYKRWQETDLERIAITEHVFSQRDLARIHNIAGELPEDENVVLGVEIDADSISLDGKLVAPTDGIDWVIVSFHKFPGTHVWWHDNSRELRAEEDLYNDWVEWAHKVISVSRPHALAHPGAMICQLSIVESFSGKVLRDFEEILQSCKEYGVAIELNEGMHRKITPAQKDSYYRVFQIAKEKQVKVTLGSDAHSLPQIGNFSWAREIAAKVGLGPEDLLKPVRTVGDYTKVLASV